MSQVFLEPARIMVVAAAVGPNTRTILPCEASAGQAEAGMARLTSLGILGMPHLPLVQQTQAAAEVARAGRTALLPAPVGLVVLVS
jgi:hypothetical protein